jgi:hypothetical protein
LFKYQLGQLKNFSRYSKFYKIIKTKQKANKIRKKKINNNSVYILKRTHKLGIVEKPQTYVKQFIMQWRSYKEGLAYWQKYASNWLRYTLFKNKTIKFYFTPLRTKKWILTKKKKNLKTYQRLTNIHPKPGLWSTIGLVGNRLGRNTNFLKRKILLRLFCDFYGTKNHKIFKYINHKYNKITSKFISDITLMLDFFERRLDVLVFRAGFGINIELTKMLVARGYIQVNGVQKQNLHFRVTTGDFISIIPNFRNASSELHKEQYESFRKIYLSRFYKPAYFDHLSSYLSSILTSISQMQGRDYWNKNLAHVKTQLSVLDNW